MMMNEAYFKAVMGYLRKKIEEAEADDDDGGPAEEI